MKEWYWFLILGVVIGTAFLPAILRLRCPSCSKRKLSQIDVDAGRLLDLEGAGPRRFLSFFACGACGAHFQRERNGPLEPADEASYGEVFARG